MSVANRLSRTSVRGDLPVVVSLTSYGDRLRSVRLALEAIAAGSVRPARLQLWTEEADIVASPPAALARLQRRGVEILHTKDWGPHKKYYPYVCSRQQHDLPLVTADDDVLYGRDWLAELWKAHRSNPEDVVAHRAHHLVVTDGRIGPYALWEDLDVHEAGPRTFATGISGVLYPPRMLDVLREAGNGFMECAPRADDVWLHAQAIRHGITVRPVHDGLTTYPGIPRTVVDSLSATNVLGGGNDQQIAATYTAADVHLLARDQARSGRAERAG